MEEFSVQDKMQHTAHTQGNQITIFSVNLRRKMKMIDMHNKIWVDEPNIYSMFGNSAINLKKYLNCSTFSLKSMRR